MVDVTRTFTVDRPVDVVVEYLCDFGHAEQWDPGTQSCTRTDSGPIAVGATWHNVSKVLGATTELTYRLERYDPGHLTFVGTNDTATSTDDIVVEPDAEDAARSRITYHAHIEFNGLAKLASPVAKLEFEHLGNETVTGITDAVARL